MSRTHGVFFIHSAPSALCPHIEWAAAGVFGVSVAFEWTPQPAQPGRYRADYSWTGPVGSAEQLASLLRGWEQLYFEVTEEATADSESQRISYTPHLGLFRATTNAVGDVVVPEGRIRAAITASADNGEPLAEALDALLGGPWDAELEPLRHAGDGAAVRWLRVV